DDFNAIPIKNGEYPKIGIVGEIYVKYNSFGNQHITEWLTEQGIEVVVPPILDFFTQWFVNTKVNIQSNLRRAEFSDLYAFSIEKYANKHLRKVEKINSGFKFYTAFDNINASSKKASEILNLANQFGEGWLIPAEIASFADEGIKYIISLQPFGCIANQVVSKGVEKRIKDLYPDINLLFLDFDAGTSEVNILNRLHFMVRNLKEEKTWV
ncbi:MAG: CoA protein activase, partial [Bacteroidota bacterium]